MADGGGEAADGFQIVIVYVGAGGEDGLDGGVVVKEIGDQNFNDGFGVEPADFFDGLAEVAGAAIGQIVAGDGGDDNVFEVEAAGGFGDAGRLVRFEGEWFGGGDGAESAGAGAMIAGDHESGGGLAPAFPMVGAFGALANGVELEFLQERAGLAEGVADGQLKAEPFRQARAGLGRCVGCVHVCLLKWLQA
jgi:hypothetical protein